MDNVIKEQKNKMNNLMNEIEQNLEFLNEEEFESKEAFDNLFKGYYKMKEEYVKLLSKCNEVMISNFSLSLDNLIGSFQEFNDNLMSNYNIQTRVCLAA